MDTQTTSFIPKRNLTTPTKTSGEGVGIFFVLALLLFIMSVVSAGAAFLYQGIVNQHIASESASLSKEQEALGISAVSDLMRTDTRIKQAKRLLATHVAPSAILQFLSQQTLENVQFTSFNYSLNSDGTAGILLNGIADSFSTVALQSDQFGSNKQLKNVLFSNVTTDQSGAVDFAVSMQLVPDAFLYSNTLSSGTDTATPASTSIQ